MRGWVGKQVNPCVNIRIRIPEPLNPHKIQAGIGWPTCNPTAGEEETEPPEKAGQPD